MRFGRLDKLFGGQPGDAQRTLDAMKRTYGPKKGQTVFDAMVIKHQRRRTRRKP